MSQPPDTSSASICIPVAPGELIDKLTILEIKLKHIDDAGKRANVRHEWELLNAVRRQQLPKTPELDKLAQELKGVNEQLWAIEDEIRLCERARDFGERFVELARSVYRTNDRRSWLKRQINELTGSAIVEEKHYQNYA